ncbi:WG repeat-containing protein [Runella salmonicolor]|uniref:WG repeat-containing protein n=1 Tax=Runella salmonicolor TaxID=2950278 RepID=A0ABT1FIP3_9BACT|nr:WG repeat-containing protein [Runella salmonicolor]MCP1381638.1 WG repeat-containing protein [Runella salmonicolor]
MKTTLHHVLLSLLVGVLLTGAACTSSTDKEEKQTVTDSLVMEQVSDGKWVIMDSKKMALYAVFVYDNGPDYPSEGLIRVVKNGKIGYADAKTYEIVIEPQFDCAYPFENGKAKVSNQCQTVKEGENRSWVSDAWEYVDKSGAKK